MIISRHRSLAISIVRLTAVATSLLMLTILIVSSSQAAFSDTTDNTANSFATGSVTITDDDGGASAMFTVSDMSPTSPVTACLELTYSGSMVPAAVRMHAATAGALAPYLDTTIEVGSGGSFSSCAGFTPSSTIYTGTLSNFSTTHSNWATGLATFSAPSNPTSATLRFTVDVQDVPAAQAKSATADFTFEAQA